MDKRKNIILVIILIIGIYIFGVLYNIIENGIELNRLNNMYKDIDILNERITMYYLDNGNIPIKGEKIVFNNSINPNDDDKYYEIDLDKLENLSINYGKEKYSEDIYIINEKSHTVYYMQGIIYNNEKFYTRNLDYQEVDLEQYK